jgi:transposase-like protein
MRPLSSHFAHDALPPLDTLLKHSKEARVFRRAQAVREVVAGQTIKAISNIFHFTNSALRKWVQRFAREGTGGLLDRPRSGRPITMTSELETQLNRLVDQDPLKHGSIGSVSKVEMVTPISLIYKVLLPSISTFETPPPLPCSTASGEACHALTSCCSVRAGWRGTR